MLLAMIIPTSTRCKMQANSQHAVDYHILNYSLSLSLSLCLSAAAVSAAVTVPSNICHFSWEINREFRVHSAHWSVLEPQQMSTRLQWRIPRFSNITFPSEHINCSQNGDVRTQLNSPRVPKCTKCNLNSVNRLRASWSRMRLASFLYQFLALTSKDFQVLFSLDRSLKLRHCRQLGLQAACV